MKNRMSLSSIIVLLCFIWGCDQPLDEQLPLEVETREEVSTAIDDKEDLLRSQKHQVVTVMGTITPASEGMKFIGVPITVSLNEMDNNNSVRTISSVTTQATYDTGFLATFQLTYSTEIVSEEAIYYISVEGKEGNDVLWRNNVMTSGIKDVYSNSSMNITVYN